MSERGEFYPDMPPARPGEDDAAYTNRLTGAAGADRVPYDHARGRECATGHHSTCSDRTHSGQCQCPCHRWRRDAAKIVSDWNKRHPVKTPVTLPADPGELDLPTHTTGPAFVDGAGLPVIHLAGFAHPIELAWVRL